MFDRDTDQHFEAVSRLLSACRGRTHAITIDQITIRAGIPDRRLTEKIIETRLADFPFPLVANGRGYYIPACAADINVYIASLRSRFEKMWRRRGVVIRKAIDWGYPRQGKVFLEPPFGQSALFSMHETRRGRPDMNATTRREDRDSQPG